jgi:hypothetical protein
MQFLWEFYDISIRCLCIFCGNSMEFLLVFCGIPMGFIYIYTHMFVFWFKRTSFGVVKDNSFKK